MKKDIKRKEVWQDAYQNVDEDGVQVEYQDLAKVLVDLVTSLLEVKKEKYNLDDCRLKMTKVNPKGSEKGMSYKQYQCSG